MRRSPLKQGALRSLAVPAAALSLLAESAAVAATSPKEGASAPAIDPSLKIAVEPVGLIAGGKRDGIYSAQQIVFGLKFNWDKIASVKGLTSHVIFVNRTGENASARLLGDNLFKSQSTIGGTRGAIVHLYEAYFDQELDGGKFDIAAGRLAVGEHFSTSDLYCDYMTNALCGYPHGLGIKQGFTTFPSSTWGARVKYQVSKEVYAEAGAYQVRPKEGGKYGFDWGWSGTTGTYIPLEVGWERKFGTQMLPGHYKIGVGLDTSKYPANFEDVNGSSFVLSGLPRRQDRGRHSVYLLADQMLARHGDGDKNGLILLGGLVHSEPDNSQISNYAFIGLRDQGIIPSRPKDAFGLLFAYAKISDSAIRSERLQQNLGEHLLYGAHGVQSNEAILEAHYKIAIGSHFSVMPDLQYVIHPGATKAQRNGLLGGMRLKADF